MKHLTTILIITLFVTYSFPLLAQSDYRAGSIITNSGDTVHGYIDYKADFLLCYYCCFKVTDAETMYEYHAWDIKGYQFDKEQKKFVSDSVSYDGYTKRIFLEVLLEGKLSLYHLIEKDLKDLFFIGKNRELKVTYIPFKRYYDKKVYDHGLNIYTKINTHTTTNHIDTLKKIMSDVPSIYPNIGKILEPTQDNLIKLLKLYHNKICYTGICITHEKKKYPLRLFVNPGAYYSFSRNNVFTGNNLYGGISASIGILNSNERLFLKTGLFVTKNNSSYQSYKSYFYNIPLQLEYRFPFKTIQPVIAYGVNLNTNYDAPTLTLTSGINIALTKSIAITVAPELCLIPFEYIPIVPVGIVSYNIFGGLQIKL